MTITKILVVEDEVIVAKTITHQLQQLGYAVTGTASSGAAAISKFQETQPDLVLMDIVLKGEMDGIATATQLREKQEIPIIYLTAYADDNTLERAKITQPFGYIVKPFTANELRVAIEIGLYKHQIAQELQENRDQLAILLQSMGDAVIATDAAGTIIFMNPAAESLTGWPQPEAIGQTVTELFQFIDEVTQLPIKNPIIKALQEHQTFALPEFLVFINRNAIAIPIAGHISLVKRAIDELSGAVLVFRDMSDRRQAEILTQALEKERELNRLKSQFVSIVSHELRNPLAAIWVATELLEKGQNLSELKQKTYLQRIRTSVSSMNQLMEDILVIGQAESDRLGCQPAPIDLVQFCHSLVEEFSLMKKGQHPISFSSQADGQTEVWVDEKLVRYILTNLLSNAIKYSPDPTPIQFFLSINPETNTASFQIQDQGIGIPATDQTRLFDSFFRASNTRSIQGTGLGLAIVKRCVDAHQGQISVSSQVGLGTTVHVTLPLSNT